VTKRFLCDMVERKRTSVREGFVAVYSITSSYERYLWLEGHFSRREYFKRRVNL